MIEMPVARGLIVCEQIIVDKLTNEVSLINCKHGWKVESFPSDHQRFVVYASLTNGSGSCNITIRIMNLSDGLTIYEQSTPLQFANPRLVIPFAYRVRHCVFPEPADYEVALLIGNEPIAACVLEIRLAEVES